MPPHSSIARQDSYTPRGSVLPMLPETDDSGQKESIASAKVFHDHTMRVLDHVGLKINTQTEPIPTEVVTITRETKIRSSKITEKADLAKAKEDALIMRLLSLPSDAPERSAFIHSKERLVKRIMYGMTFSPLEDEDAFQFGLMGVNSAIDDYRPMGNKFDTYATFRIR